MTNDNNYNLYITVDDLELTPFEKYKYLTKNDTNIVKLKQQVREIVKQRNLSSVMNNTKWLKLQQAIKTLPFAPAYREKLIQQNKAWGIFKNSKLTPSSHGNWSSFWDEGLPVFFAIEWLEISPKYAKDTGPLGTPKIIDITKELVWLLCKLYIPFEQENDFITIYGYK